MILTGNKGVSYIYKKVVIHYPKDKEALSQIAKDITSFRCNETIRYVESLNLNNKQLATLYDLSPYPADKGLIGQLILNFPTNQTSH